MGFPAQRAPAHFPSLPGAAGNSPPLPTPRSLPGQGASLVKEGSGIGEEKARVGGGAEAARREKDCCPRDAEREHNSCTGWAFISRFLAAHQLEKFSSYNLKQSYVSKSGLLGYSDFNPHITHLPPVPQLGGSDSPDWLAEMTAWAPLVSVL